jgi:hypothetical protein
MKYLCLVYLEDAKLHAVPDSECLAASERLRAEGRVVAAEALHPVHTATTLRVRDGALTMIDGPFAETKELIGGYAIVEVASKDEAIRLTREFLQLHRDVLGPGYEGESEIREMIGVTSFVPAHA